MNMTRETPLRIVHFGKRPANRTTPQTKTWPAHTMDKLCVSITNPTDLFPLPLFFGVRLWIFLLVTCFAVSIITRLGCFKRAMPSLAPSSNRNAFGCTASKTHSKPQRRWRLVGNGRSYFGHRKRSPSCSGRLNISGRTPSRNRNISRPNNTPNDWYNRHGSKKRIVVVAQTLQIAIADGPQALVVGIEV